MFKPFKHSHWLKNIDKNDFYLNLPLNLCETCNLIFILEDGIKLILLRLKYIL